MYYRKNCLPILVAEKGRRASRRKLFNSDVIVGPQGQGPLGPQGTQGPQATILQISYILLTSNLGIHTNSPTVY